MEKNMKVIITGASSGLGAAIAKWMSSYADVINWSLNTGVDVSDQLSVEAAVKSLKFDKVDVLINCAGVNDICWLPELQEEVYDYVMSVNAKGIFLCTQALLHLMRGGTIVNIVSNASHVPMTCSLAYNASKGAAAIMTRQLARELKKTNDMTVFAISPNKLKDTGMSKYIDQSVQQVRGWTAQKAREYQLAALPAGEETDPNTLAEFIAFLLSSKERHKYLNGCDIPYGA